MVYMHDCALPVVEETGDFTDNRNTSVTQYVHTV